MKLLLWLSKGLPYALFIAFAILCWRWFEFSTTQSHDLAEPIINGVIGGIVTSLLILIFSIVWQSNITPWIENLLYKDTKIEGVWDGVLVPHIGIDEIDKRRLQVAMGVIEKRRRKRSKKNNEKTKENIPKSTLISATSTDESGEQEDLEAELILKKERKKENQNDEDEVIDRKFFIKISSGVEPIEVRAEIKRVGHSIEAKLVEIGGASQIHTYTVKGSFKNLILTGEYENDDSSNIDRGSLSLMLRKNGNKLEGFFSSYADHDHHMAPFKCVLTRHLKSV